MGSTLPCRQVPTGTCSLAEAEEGANTARQAQATAFGWSPTPWYCLTGRNSIKLPCLWKRNTQLHTLVCSTLFIDVGVHWGWPDLWLISTTLCSSKSVCIQVIAEQQGAMLSDCACKSRYLMAAPGISGHLHTASVDICRHTCITFELSCLILEVRLKELSIS